MDGKFDVVVRDNVMTMTPVVKLSDAEYDVYKQHFEVMGGHWRESVQAFVFYLDQLVRNDKARLNEINQFYPTPKSVAKIVVAASGLNEPVDISSIQVLEPSAGNGALLSALPTRLLFTVTAVEPDTRHHAELRRYVPKVMNCTFEDYCSTTESRFTHVLMNPPFSDDRDMRHIRLAYDLLKQGGRLVAVMSENSLHRDTLVTRNFRQWLGTLDMEYSPLPPGSFRESGTSIDTMLLIIDK